MAYHHFTTTDRRLLQKLKMQGFSNSYCARILGYHSSTIGRELRKGYCNSTKTNYHVTIAGEKTRLRRLKANQQHRRLFNNSKQSEVIITLLKEYWSPDQIANQLKLSNSTIYRWLWNQDKELINNLRPYLRQPKMRRRYGTKRREKQRELLKKRWIDDRPEIINKRLTYGHWEGDTVFGNRNSGYLVTMVERKSGFLLVDLIPNKTKQAFKDSTINLFKVLPLKAKQSLTLDNGTEMNSFEAIEKQTKAMIYFAHPYHSWERGTNENTNGLLRQFFPKNKDFSTITKKELEYVANLINNRPRKRLNYQTPNQVFTKFLKRIAV